MRLESMAAWLRCPHCGEPLEARPPLSLHCATGHSYDVNKRGFVNLVPAADRMIGDSAEMLDARDDFLTAGWYDPIVEAVVRSIPSSAGTIVDAGCGTGFYLSHARAGRPGLERALAFDLSPEAVRRAVRQTGADGLVADTWRPLPVRDGVADVILDVFAPRNLPEFHRILAPNGSLVVAVPTAAHLSELREDGAVLDIPAGKAERLLDGHETLFALEHAERVEFAMQPDESAIRSLVGMGPSAHHRQADVGIPARVTVTASVDVLRFGRL